MEASLPGRNNPLSKCITKALTYSLSKENVTNLYFANRIRLYKMLISNFDLKLDNIQVESNLKTNYSNNGVLYTIIGV